MDKWIEIARTGTFTDSAGRQQTFTEKDLDAIASAYDPQKRDDAARQNSLGECVITSGTSDCTQCKKIAKAGHVPAFFMSSH